MSVDNSIALRLAKSLTEDQVFDLASLTQDFPASLDESHVADWLMCIVENYKYVQTADNRLDAIRRAGGVLPE